jgi:hypothetical protein
MMLTLGDAENDVPPASAAAVRPAYGQTERVTSRGLAVRLSLGLLSPWDAGHDRFLNSGTPSTPNISVQGYLKIPEMQVSHVLVFQRSRRYTPARSGDVFGRSCLAGRFCPTQPTLNLIYVPPHARFSALKPSTLCRTLVRAVSRSYNLPNTPSIASSNYMQRCP